MGNLMRLKNSIEEWEAILKNELWEEDAFERDISPTFWLSYYDLPPAIKRCFSFCAVFPKDKAIKRDELIHLWMAHNNLKPIGNKEMEMIGGEYFEHLAAASFFQDFKKDADGNIIECKMHDILHDFAQLLTNGECFKIERGERSQRHMKSSRDATCIMQRDIKNITSVSSMKKLHTLLVSDPKYCGCTSLSFKHLTSLRALSLGGWERLKELPNEVGNLIHLRYLDLSYCKKLKELPETICNLHNLQTQNIRECRKLRRLPQAMHELTNLRHLKNYMFGLGVARTRGLNSLQTLDWFVISRDGDEKCKIGDLRNLNKLRGELTMFGLNEVEDASKVEEAELEKKIHIQKLTLMFEGKTKKDVAEAIKFPPKLKDLIVWNYGEAELPGCLMSSSSLTHLRILKLYNLKKCSGLPSWGELPALEHLHINRMESVEYVGDEFVGSSLIAFPKLKQLSFSWMNEWKKWEIKEDKQKSIMPSLQVLELEWCQRLEVLPDHLLQRTELQALWKIHCCFALWRRYEDAFSNSKFPFGSWQAEENQAVA